MYVIIIISFSFISFIVWTTDFGLKTLDRYDPSGMKNLSEKPVLTKKKKYILICCGKMEIKLKCNRSIILLIKCIKFNIEK